MTTPRSKRILGRDERGISSVLGAILLFGLLIVTLVKVRVEFVPVWDHDRESGFMGQVSGELAQIKTDLDRQVANQTSASISDPLELGGGNSGFTFFRGTEKNGVVTFTPRQNLQGFTIAANPLVVQSRDGVALESLQSYTALTNGQTLTSVAAMDALKIRFDNPSNGAGVASSGATMRIDVTTAANNCAGQLILSIGGAPGTPPRDIQLQTIPAYPGGTGCSASGHQAVHVRDTLIGCASPCVSPATYFFDALDPDLVFDQVLASARDSGPWTVTFTMTGATPVAASGILVYEQVVAGGINRVGGGGATTANYASQLAAGTLTMSKQNQRFPSQSYVLEYGAIILDQEGKSAMAVPPIFQINTTATQARLDIVLPALTGTPNQVGAAAAATVTSTPQGQRGSLEGQTPCVTITLSTIYGQTWANYWEGIFTQAGFAPANGCVVGAAGYSASCTSLASPPPPPCTTVANPSDLTATLTFSGPNPDNVSNDVLINLHTGPLAVDLRATG